jgi:hypothetical protein
MRAVLLRFADSPFGCFGWLDVFDATDQRVGRFTTMEDDWLDNLPGVSAIPAGRYTCRRTIYHKHGIETYEITDVPGRSRILFHPGNSEEDVQGCVALGTDFGAVTVKDEDDPQAPPRLKWSVVRSRYAFEVFMAPLDGVQEFPIEVRWAQPGEWRIA